MNLNRIKAVVWLGALSMGGFLGWYVYDFWQHRAELAQRVSPERQKEVLESVEQPPPPKEVVVDYDLVRAGYHTLNWTGKEKPKPVKPVVVDEGPKEKPVVPIDDIIEVLLVVVDTGNAAGSSATIRYKADTPGARNPKKPRGRGRPNRPSRGGIAGTDMDSVRLRIGDALEAPYDNAIVEAIERGGVRFTFTDDEERESELVATIPFPSERGIVVVDADGVVKQPKRKSSIPRVDGPVFVPNETYATGPNSFRVGKNDAATFNRDYARILSREVRLRKHRDPATGRVNGLTVTDVSGNSIVARHGVKAGMVIKSINGHKVTSVNSAISYVKKEAPTTDRWEVVVEEFGRERTIMYDSPPSD